MEIKDTEVYTRVGEEGFRRLVTAFYRRVREDDVLGPMYPQHDWEGAEDRLRLFLIQRFGGPFTYSEKRGHPRLRMRHAPFRVDSRARDRWVALMNEALTEAAVPAEVAPLLKVYFEDTATFMMNHAD